MSPAASIAVSFSTSHALLSGDYPARVRAFKRLLLFIELIRHRGNRTHAASALGIEREYLHRLLRDLDVPVPDPLPAMPTTPSARRAPVSHVMRPVDDPTHGWPFVVACHCAGCSGFQWLDLTTASTAAQHGMTRARFVGLCGHDRWLTRQGEPAESTPPPLRTPGTKRARVARSSVAKSPPPTS